MGVAFVDLDNFSEVINCVLKLFKHLESFASLHKEFRVSWIDLNATGEWPKGSLEATKPGISDTNRVVRNFNHRLHLRIFGKPDRLLGLGQGNA